MKELLFVDQARLTWPQTAPTSRHKATTNTPFSLYRQDDAKRKKAARVQETTSLPTSAPANSIIRSSAPKGIGNCTILLSIQIGVKDGHDT
jgi:hypothetical protein